LSRKKRTSRLDAIKAACQAYIGGPLRSELSALAKATMEAAGQDPNRLRIVLDEQDTDRQSLLIHYPSAVEASRYVTPSVKIESGAKSAVDPNEAKSIAPYLSSELHNGDALTVTGVTTILPERTLLDKILILHGMTFYYRAKGALRGNGRMSRHYYDVHRLMQGAVGESGCTDDALIEDCVRHAKMFFYRSNTGLEEAQRGTFSLRPSDEMLGPLRGDYEAMATMIFGEVPSFETVLDSVGRAEDLLNAV
jgi:hypothetical protein